MPQSVEVARQINEALNKFFQDGLALTSDDNAVNVSADGSYIETTDFDSANYTPIERDGKMITRHIKTVFTRSQYVVEFEQAQVGEPIPIDQAVPVA